MSSWLDGYPKIIKFKWQCSCGRQHDAEFHSAEPGDLDTDSYHFTCECGLYYKKFCRVGSSQRPGSFVISEEECTE